MQIIGASGHCKVILEALKVCGVDVTGVWDDDNQLKEFMGLNVLGDIDACREAKVSPLIVAIGNNQIRKKVVKQFGLDTTFGIAFHPSAVISESAKLLEGTVVMANASINASTQIGRHVIVNTNASVDHDCIIEDYVHISPQVGLAGNVKVGEGTHIGIGACVIQGIRIGRWCIIGAGSVVIKDVPDGSTVVGNPGRIIKVKPKQ